VWERSIDRMLSEDHPKIRYVSPRGWIKKTDYLQLGRDGTVLSYATRIADHEVRHLDQLRRTVKS